MKIAAKVREISRLRNALAEVDGWRMSEAMHYLREAERVLAGRLQAVVNLQDEAALTRDKLSKLGVRT